MRQNIQSFSWRYNSRVNLANKRCSIHSQELCYCEGGAQYVITSYVSTKDVPNTFSRVNLSIRGAQYILKSYFNEYEVLNTYSGVTLARKRCSVHSPEFTLTHKGCPMRSQGTTPQQNTVRTTKVYFPRYPAVSFSRCQQKKCYSHFPSKMAETVI